MNFIKRILCIALSFYLAGCAPSIESENKMGDQEKTMTGSNSTTDISIAEKYWKLVELDGKQVSMAKNQETEIHFVLKTEGNQLSGFSGCNRFFGTYALSEGSRIRFEKIASTRRACPDAEINEQEFLNVFGLADNYTISGDTLELNVGRRAPLAVFNAVYFQ